jgi:hypothetical protein
MIISDVIEKIGDKAKQSVQWLNNDQQVQYHKLPLLTFMLNI